MCRLLLLVHDTYIITYYTILILTHYCLINPKTFFRRFTGVVRRRQLCASHHSAQVQTHIAGRFDRTRLETANRGKLGRTAARQQQDASATYVFKFSS